MKLEKLKDNYTLGFLGCGNLGTAILSGILNNDNDTTSRDAARPGHILVSVTRQPSVDRLKAQFGSKIDVMIDNGKVAQGADVLIIGCKPYTLIDLVNSSKVKPHLEGKIIISLCAGVRISNIYMALSYGWKVGVQYPLILRAMSNTPAQIGVGMTMVAVPCTDSDETANHTVQKLLGTEYGAASAGVVVDSIVLLFTKIGRCIQLPEKQIDVFTAIAGSGPAFVFQYLESMIDGAVSMGLPAVQAKQICAQTLLGAAQMVLAAPPETHPAQLRQQVTTPAGCTIAGLLAMEDGKIRSTIARGVQEATRTAAGLK